MNKNIVVRCVLSSLSLVVIVFLIVAAVNNFRSLSAIRDSIVILERMADEHELSALIAEGHEREFFLIIAADMRNYAQQFRDAIASDTRWGVGFILFNIPLIALTVYIWLEPKLRRKKHELNHLYDGERK